jgi:hypothetical protein
MLDQMSEHEKTVAATYCNYNGLKDTQSIANICQQANDISYVELDVNTWGSKEEKLGYTIVDEIDSELKATLEQYTIGDNLTTYDYFDFEKYGQDLSMNNGYFATDNLFIFHHTDINPKLYTIQELKEHLNDPRLNET